MTYAKLSGALLARKEEPAAVSSLAQTISVPAAPPAPVQNIAPAPLSGERAKLLAHHLRALKLPMFLADYERVARQCAAEGLDHTRFLLRLAELELVERGQRTIERRIREARFPALKDLDSFDFTAVPSLDKSIVLDLVRCDYVTRSENIIAIGNSGTGKTHLAIGLGLAACHNGLSVCFTTAASLVRELVETHDERRLLRLQRRLAAYQVLIIDELGYVPLPSAGAELLFEIISHRHERGSTIITSNLPLGEWISVFGSARMTEALLDRLSHHVHVLDMHGDSYRLKLAQRQQAPGFAEDEELTQRAG
jgi:DNA replication protein DnaC